MRGGVYAASLNCSSKLPSNIFQTVDPASPSLRRDESALLFAAQRPLKETYEKPPFNPTTALQKDCLKNSVVE
jgi:hypothetical protein